MNEKLNQLEQEVDDLRAALRKMAAEKAQLIADNRVLAIETLRVRAGSPPSPEAVITSAIYPQSMATN